MKGITKKKKVIAQQWGAGLISFREVQKQLDVSTNSAYITLARALRELHYKNND